MKTKLILGFILALLIMVFTIQNSEVVTVKFLMWQVTLSRALLILISFGLGAIFYVVISYKNPLKKVKDQKMEPALSDDKDDSEQPSH